jgi:uncharacterized protein YjcR
MRTRLSKSREISDRPTYSTYQVAQFLGVKESTVRSWRDRDRHQVDNLGPKWVYISTQAVGYLIEEFQTWAAKHRAEVVARARGAR